MNLEKKIAKGEHYFQKLTIYYNSNKQKVFTFK